MNTFCVLPFFGQEFTGITPTSKCCLLPQNHDIEQVKIDMLAGRQPVACQKCWNLEASNIKSKRQYENEFLDYKLDRDLSNIVADCNQGNYEVLMYQLTTSNLCNQACVTCNGTFSTKWAELDKKLGFNRSSKYSSTSGIPNINYKSARRINLLGGEPLFDFRTFDILNNLILADNTDCFISIITNGSIKLSQDQIAILSQFSDLNICVSIDGIGPVFEYMRWPTKWSTLLENINQYKSIVKDISVSYTISSLNVMYYDKTVNWFKENNLNYNHNIVTYPNWISLAGMPIVLKNKINNNTFLKSWTEFNEPVPLTEYIDNIQQQDTVKKIKINDYLPEVASIIFDTVEI